MHLTKPKSKIFEINFKSFFDKYFPSLCVFAHKFVKDEDLAKDMVQEVFVRIWNLGINFESEKSMKVYFYLATKNICFDYMKKEKRRYILDELKDDLCVEEEVINLIIREETYRLLGLAIEHLPAKAKEVMHLNLKGLTNLEIAEDMGVSVNTIKTHKLLAFRKLRLIMGKQFALILMVEFYQFLK